MVQVALAVGHDDVVHAGLDFLRERAVALDAQLEIGAVVADHVHLGLRQLVAFGLIDPALDGLDDFRVVERVDVVPALAVATVAGEVALVLQPFKRHAEVVALRVERVAGMFYL